jgi:hypothetical protein|nr:MAG TPA: tail assembly chaperone protein [Caudoviricetes sp.]DAV00859.1 MAG TPA: tail assembly chaperone protein [Caudoviricetes sp.]
MLKFQLKSGKMVELNLAPMDNALYLYRTIIHECKGAGLDITAVDGESIAAVLTKNIDALLSVIGSEYVLEAIKGCADKVIYDKQRFNMEIFDRDEKARGDFFPLMTLIAVENIRPFFPSLNSVSSAIESLLLRS